MDQADPQPTRLLSQHRAKLAVALIWKTLALLLALVVGLIAANSLGWNGGEWLLGSSESDGLGAFINHLILVVSAVGCAAVLYFVARIAKWALWGFAPLMVYAALVLGTWDGVASGFDATRVDAIRHHYANAYALEHMRRSAVHDTCRDARITLAVDARAICSARGY